jgi:hypothetical protein
METEKGSETMNTNSILKVWSPEEASLHTTVVTALNRIVATDNFQFLCQ